MHQRDLLRPSREPTLVGAVAPPQNISVVHHVDDNSLEPTVFVIIDGENQVTSLDPAP